MKELVNNNDSKDFGLFLVLSQETIRMELQVTKMRKAGWGKQVFGEN